MKVIVITELRHDKNFQLQPLHEIAQFSRSTYYYILKNLVKPDKYKVTIELIMKIFKEHKRRYGYSRITKTLRTEYNCFINNKTVRRLMKELGIASRIRIKKYRSCRGIVGNIAKNLLKRDFLTTRIHEKWVTDITEFNVCGKKVYLSPIIDLHTKEIITYSAGFRPNLDLVMDMLRIALKKKKLKGLILHSDQGWHYQHTKYRRTLKKAKIMQGMSRKGNCLDNTVAENFFSHVKAESFKLETFESIELFFYKLHEYMNTCIHALFYKEGLHKMIDIIDLLKLNRIQVKCHSCDNMIEMKTSEYQTILSLVFCPICYSAIDLNPNHKLGVIIHNSLCCL